MKKRITAILMAMVMALSLLPVSAFAVEDEPDEPEVVEGIIDPGENQDNNAVVHKTAKRIKDNTWEITINVKAKGNTIERKPLEVVLVMDASGSMQWGVNNGNKIPDDHSESRMEIAKSAASGLVQQLYNAGLNVSVAVASFNGDVTHPGSYGRPGYVDEQTGGVKRILTKLTDQSNVATVTNAIPGFAAANRNATHMDEGLSFGYGAFSTNANTEKVIIMLSDGEHNGSTDPVAYATNTLKPNKIKVYTVGFTASNTTLEDITNAAAPGGQYYTAEGSSSLIDAFGKIAADLSALVADPMGSDANSDVNIVENSVQKPTNSTSNVNDNGDLIWNPEHNTIPAGSDMTITYQVTLKDLQALDVGSNIDVHLNGDAKLNYSVNGGAGQDLAFNVPIDTIDIGRLDTQRTFDGETNSEYPEETGDNVIVYPNNAFNTDTPAETITIGDVEYHYVNSTYDDSTVDARADDFALSAAAGVHTLIHHYVSGPKVTGITKTVVADKNDVPNDVNIEGVTFAENGKFVVANGTESVKLLYVVTVSGAPDAAYEVKDEGAAPETVKGVIPKSGFIDLYFTKTFDNLTTGDNICTNSATVNEGESDEDKTPDVETEVTVEDGYTVTYEWSGLPEGATSIFSDLNKPEDDTVYAKGATYKVDSKYFPNMCVTIDVDGVEHFYKFSGWKLDGKVVTGTQTMGDADVTLVGEWVDDTAEFAYWTLTYNANRFNGDNATAVDAEMVKIGTYGVVHPDPCMFENPGYKFVGWSFKPEDDTIFTGGELALSRNKNLYAQWEEEPIRVVFHIPGDAEWKIAEDAYDFTMVMTTTNKKSPNATSFDWVANPDKVFVRWDTAMGDYSVRGGMPLKYQDLAHHIDDEGVVHLYAVFNGNVDVMPETIRVYFVIPDDARWGNAKSFFELNVDDAMIYQAPNGTSVEWLSHPNRVLTGWMTADGDLTLATSGDFDFSSMYKYIDENGNVFLYAVFDDVDVTPETVKVTYVYNYGGKVESVEIPYGSKADDRSASRSDYTFKGWYADAELTVPYDFSARVTEDVTVYAKWSKKSSGGSTGGGGGNDKLNTKDHYSYIIGYKDGGLMPYGTITRGEVATIFFRLLTDDARDEYWCTTNSYTDVPETLWCNNAISTLSNMGIIDGYQDGSFRPYGKITRAQFAKMAVGFFETTAKAYKGYFEDVPEDAWFTSYVEAAARVGLINGFEDGTFRPNTNITRAQACVIVNRALDRKPDKDHLLPERKMIMWPDIDEDDWFYADMMEATNSHDYRWITVKVDGEKTEIEEWTKKLPQRDWAAFETMWADANAAPGGEVVKD